MINLAISLALFCARLSKIAEILTRLLIDQKEYLKSHRMPIIYQPTKAAFQTSNVICTVHCRGTFPSPLSIVLNIHSVFSYHIPIPAQEHNIIIQYARFNLIPLLNQLY